MSVKLAPSHRAIGFTKVRILLLVTIGWAATAGAQPPGNPDVEKAEDAFSQRQFGDSLRSANAALQREPSDFRARFLRARAHAALKSYDAAIADFTRLIELDRPQALSAEIRADDRRGDAYLKNGQAEKAIVDFDTFLTRQPDFEPHHWRRGIAFYYADEFKRGVSQFELHQSVNGSDVENSVWHFLCNARLVGIEKATKTLIPLAGEDQRIPMMKVFDMFAGDARPADVLKVVHQEHVSVRQSEPALFYAHLYTGLYYEAISEPVAAAKHIRLAADKHTSPHYMGDVARAHLKIRKWDKIDANGGQDNDGGKKKDRRY